MNEQRTERAKVCMAAGGYSFEFFPQTSITNALTDLRHLAKQHGLDFEKAVTMSGVHFYEEL